MLLKMFLVGLEWLLNVCQTVSYFYQYMITVYIHSDCITGPEGCPEDLTGGLPLYQGFEQDVLQSVITYFQSLSEPIVPPKLFNLFMMIHPHLDRNASRATDALQLCCLLLPQQKRIQTHRLLRMIHKACRNTLLHLSEARSNDDVVRYLLHNHISLSLVIIIAARTAESTNFTIKRGRNHRKTDDTEKGNYRSHDSALPKNIPSTHGHQYHH